jgi:hypothetical protein
MNAQTKIEGLTESRYNERCRELDRSLQSAEEDCRGAALKLELGEIDEAEFQPFQTAVATIKSRKIGLDAAWEEAQRLAVREAIDREATAKRKAAQACRKIGAKLADDRRQIDEILSTLAPHLKRLREHEGKLRRIIEPYMHSGIRPMDPDRFRSRNTQFIEGAVCRHGLGHWGMGTAQKPGGPAWAISPKPPEDHDTLESLAEQDEADFRHAAEVLTGGEEN